MPKFILQILALFLFTTLAQAAPLLDQWHGSGPFATGQGNRIVNTLAVSADGMTVYAGSGSGTAFSYAYSDTTAPTLNASVSGVTQTAATLNATSSEAATGYWIVIARNAAAPTAAEVKAGLSYSGVSIVAGGSGAMTAAQAKAFAVAGLTAGTSYDLYVAAEDASTNLSGSPILVAFATPATPAAPAPAPVPEPASPIPNIGNQPYIPGIDSQPSMLSMGNGAGPSMTACLMTTLRQALGGNPVYQGQTANGAVQIAWNGQLISVYFLSASTTNIQDDGIHLQNSNTLNVVTACGTLNAAPALINPSEIGAILNSMGLHAQINAQGVISVWVNGTYYVVRPDYLTTPGTPGTPSLVMGEDGLFRFTDSSGNSQVIHPAFLDTEALQNQLRLVLGAADGNITIQIDGTAVLTVDGRQYVLTPDLTLGGIPPEHAMDYWWQDGANHYRYRIGVANFSTNSQGFTVKSR